MSDAIKVDCSKCGGTWWALGPDAIGSLCQIRGCNGTLSAHVNESIAFFGAMLRDEIRHEVAKFSNDMAKRVAQNAAAMILEKLQARGNHVGGLVLDEYGAALKELGLGP